MTAAEQIGELLERKRAIEAGTYMQEHALGNARLKWLHEAVELLLRLELERQAEQEREARP